MFCVWDRLYRLDLADPKATPRPVNLVAQADDVMLELQRAQLDKEISEAVISPDGKSLAVVARGEIFVRSTAEGYPTRRVTNTPGRERDLAWSPDGRVLYFASDDPGLAGESGTDGGTSNLGKYSIYQATVSLAREDISPKKEDGGKDKPDAKGSSDEPAKSEPGKDDAKPASDDSKKDDSKKDDGAKSGAPDKPKKPDFGKRWAEALEFKIELVATDPKDMRFPVPSPDAKALLVTRGLGDLVLIELDGMKQRVLFTGWNEPEAQWAGDSRHIVYSVEDLDFNSDIWLMDTGGFDSFDPASTFKATPPINLTRHPDEDTMPRLSVDGKVLTFFSQRGEQNDQVDVYQVYLDKELEGMTAYERDEYYKKQSELVGKRKPAETPAFALKKLAIAKTSEKPEDAAKDPAPQAPPAPAAKPDEAKAEDAKPKPKKPVPMQFDADDAYLRIRRITSLPGPKASLQITPRRTGLSSPARSTASSRS